MERILMYWKPILCALAIAAFVWYQHSTIKDLRKDNAQLELKLQISNQSIETMKKTIELQNSAYQLLENNQKVKQSETEAYILKLLQENKSLQEQMQDIMNTPETGNECQDIQNLLLTVGD